jgi:preprotein translocase subunit SecB
MSDQTKPELQTEQQPEFTIQRIFVKGISFETEHVPAIFQQEWKPDLNLQLQTNTAQLEKDVHEVVLKVTVTVKSEDKVAFLIEVEQAGIFTLQRFPEEQLRAVLGSVCPNILFPYAREAITDLAARGTFPPLYLAPVNFDALYAQHLEQQKSGDGSGGQSSIITH